MPQNTLVQLAYAAALGEESWNAFLAKLQDAAHAVSTGLVTVSNAKTWARIRASSNFDPERQREYETHYFPANPWVLTRIARPEVVLPTEMILSTEDLMKTDYYNNYMRRWGAVRM